MSNIAAMRDALVNSNGLLKELTSNRLLKELTLIGEWGESARAQIAENNAALAKSPHNCSKLDESVKEEGIAFAHELRPHMRSEKIAEPQPCQNLTFSAWLYALWQGTSWRTGNRDDNRSRQH